MRLYRLAVICVLILILPVLPLGKHVFAEVPYPSFAYDTSGDAFPVQAPYIPEKVIGAKLFTIDSNNLEIAQNGIKKPGGIYVDNKDNIFVADTQNNRVVKIDIDGRLLKEYGTGPVKDGILKNPEGIYVSDQGDVYVADTGNNRIAIFRQSGEFIRDIKKPQDPRLEKAVFVPVKVSLDVRGFLFVVIKGGNEGIMVISPEGNFEGYFGSNKVYLPVLDRIKRAIFTSEQLKKDSIKEAPSITSVYMGDDGYIYVCTRNVQKGQIKKYNSGADDLFKEKQLIDRNPSNKVRSSFGDIVVDNNGNITTIDLTNSTIYQYDNNGEPLFTFGYKPKDNMLQVGLFGDPSGIAADSAGRLYVTDKTHNCIHVFQPTEFAKKVHRATAMYADGKYNESELLWQEVLKLNVNYYKANLGIGKSYYKNKRWEEAMEQFKMAMRPELYSDALWQIRLEWMQRNFGIIATFLLSAAFVFMVYNRITRGRKRVKM